MGPRFPPSKGRDSAFPPEEGPTAKLPVMAEAKVRCPRCNGKILLVAEPVVPSATPVDLSQHGAFRAEWCGYCSNSDGLVTPAEAELIRAAMKRESI